MALLHPAGHSLHAPMPMPAQAPMPMPAQAPMPPPGYVFVPAPAPPPSAAPAAPNGFPHPVVATHGWYYVPPPPPTAFAPPQSTPVAPVPCQPFLMPQRHPHDHPHEHAHHAVYQHSLREPAPRPAEKVSAAFPDAVTQRAIDLDTRGCESEPGVVNVRLLLLKSRDMRRKLRAAMHHATRPRQLLNHNEAAKVQRRDHFAARLAAMERTARACGMLPPTPAMVSAQASAFRAQGRKHSSTGPLSKSAADGDDEGSDNDVPRWSSTDLVAVFSVDITAAGSKGASLPFEPNYAAALELFKGGRMAPATTRMEIHAALYRKFILSAAFHAARVQELMGSTPYLH